MNNNLKIIDSFLFPVKLTSHEYGHEPKGPAAFFLVSWRGGVRLSPLGTSATNWSIVPVPDDR
jgi:hypothetical protein